MLIGLLIKLILKSAFRRKNVEYFMVKVVFFLLKIFILVLLCIDFFILTNINITQILKRNKGFLRQFNVKTLN